MKKIIYRNGCLERCDVKCYLPSKGATNGLFNQNESL